MGVQLAMRRELEGFYKVDISKLNIGGLVLLAGSIGIAMGGMLGAVLATRQAVSGNPRTPFRGPVILAWAAAAALFFGGRWLLNAMGLSVNRKKAALGRRRTMMDWC